MYMPIENDNRLRFLDIYDFIDEYYLDDRRRKVESVRSKLGTNDIEELSDREGVRRHRDRYCAITKEI